MLADDQHFVARDSSITGLSQLLCTDDAANLQSLVGWSGASDVRVSYLRYKPHTSCLAEFQARVDGHMESAYAIAFADSQADKLAKLEREAASDVVVIDPHANLFACRFPFDRRLPALGKLIAGHDRLLERIVPAGVDPNEIQIHRLRYKPERRFVARIDCQGEPIATVKLYTPGGYQRARRVAKRLGSLAPHSSLQVTGHMDRHAAISFAWLPGGAADAADWPNVATQAAHAIAGLHTRSVGKLPKLTKARLLQRLRSASDFATWLAPEAEQLIHASHSAIAYRLSRLDLCCAALHGDLHVQQLIVTEHGLSLIDFDRACTGPPEWDLANLLVDLQHRHPSNPSSPVTVAGWHEFLDCYTAAGGSVDLAVLQTLTALRRFELAIEPFRQRQSHWSQSLQQRVVAASELALRVPHQPRPGTESLSADPGLPWLSVACDARQAQHPLGQAVPHFELAEAKLIRHKQGRRALIEYRGTNRLTGAPCILIGKTEHKPRHRRRLVVQRRLWQAGWDANSADGISVAQPCGDVPRWNMWLQEYVAGFGGWQALTGPRSIEYAIFAARAIAKLHRSGMPVDKTHTLADEGAALRDRLAEAAHLAPQLRSRIERIGDCYAAILFDFPEPEQVVLHRDFYPDQLQFSGDRVTLLDLDLICHGPACIDIGNFVGHLVEMGIRRYNDPQFFDDVQRVFVETYLSESPICDRELIELSQLMTLARHIYISQSREHRHHFTPAILRHCEQLLEHHCIDL